MRSKALCLCVMLAVPAAAQEPLSPIDWLTDVAREAEEQRALNSEPPVRAAPQTAQVDVQTLSEPERRAYGLIPTERTGLPVSLWHGSLPEALGPRLEKAPARLFAAADLLWPLLLGEAWPPATGDVAPWLQARAARLSDMGAVPQAQAVLALAPNETSEIFADWVQLALLDSGGNTGCARWSAAPWLSDDMRLRIFCLARGNDWSAALTVLNGAEALGSVTAADAGLLLRFLDPALAEELPPLAPPVDPDALTFRLYEAIGTPLPTGPLPHPFAVTQLGGDAGWKAQIEAAERLTRTGALPPAALFEIYAARTRPAASGGVWDRVAAAQAVLGALNQGDAALSDAAARAFDVLRPAGLVPALARHFGALLPAQVPDDASDAANEKVSQLRLLAGVDQAGSLDVADTMAHAALLRAVALGHTPPVGISGRHASAIAAAFAMRPSLPEIDALVDEDRLGEALLRALELLDAGALGDGPALTRGLRILRVLGFDDIARAAAIEVLILDPLA